MRHDRALQLMDGYKTLIKSVCAEYTLKRSRFLCYAKPIANEQSATAFIKEIAARHWDASHNVWAYALREGQRTRYSDDGEPQGTAGLPVLEALRSRRITDAVLVVTRYYGGVRLGASGLIRAYAHSAGLGIEESGVAEMQPCVRLKLSLPYARFKQLEHILAQLGGVFVDTVFAENVTAIFDLSQEAQEQFLALLMEFVSGTQAETLGLGYFRSN